MRMVPELAGGGWTVGGGAVSVNGKAVGEAGVSTVVTGEELGVMVSAKLVAVAVVVKAQTGPIISPIAISGPFTPTRTLPGISSPESTTLNSPRSKPAPDCHLIPFI